MGSPENSLLSLSQYTDQGRLAEITMGSIVGKTMEDNFKKQQEFMLEMNRITLERQIQMQNQMRERMVAQQVAGAREIFLWLASFYLVAGAGMISGFTRTKKPVAIAPLLPLTFIVGYQADLAYGSKVNRIRAEAENILQYERDLTDCPAGLPSLSSIDAARIRAQDEKKYHATSPRH